MTLPVYDGQNAQFIFDLIAQTLIDTGGRQVKLRFGTGTFAFVASNDTTTTVAHGLGTTPVAVLITPEGNGTDSQSVGVDNIGATSFRATSRRDAGSATVNKPFYWIALG